MPDQNIITIEPGKRSGKPCIRGMRITVYDVLSYLAAGMTYEEVLADFPYLTKEDILACLSYAAEREKQTLSKLNEVYSQQSSNLDPVMATMQFMSLPQENW